MIIYRWNILFDRLCWGLIFILLLELALCRFSWTAILLWGKRIEFSFIICYTFNHMSNYLRLSVLRIINVQFQQYCNKHM